MRRSQLVRFVIALVIAIFCCGALNLFDDWTLEEMPVRFVVGAILGGIAYLVAVIQFPCLTSRRAQVSIFWFVTVALRLVVLPLTPGDDFWRYQWEGKIQQSGFNPYLEAPDDPKLDPVRAGFSQWPKINHREFRAIYPPGAELL